MNDFIALSGCAVMLAVAFAVMVKSRCRHRFDWNYICVRCGKPLGEIIYEE